MAPPCHRCYPVCVLLALLLRCLAQHTLPTFLVYEDSDTRLGDEFILLDGDRQTVVSQSSDPHRVHNRQGIQIQDQDSFLSVRVSVTRGSLSVFRAAHTPSYSPPPPSLQPSLPPSPSPTFQPPPSAPPTVPSALPTAQPSVAPGDPTLQPSAYPTSAPSTIPTLAPSVLVLSAAPTALSGQATLSEGVSTGSASTTGQTGTGYLGGTGTSDGTSLLLSGNSYEINAILDTLKYTPPRNGWGYDRLRVDVYGGGYKAGLLTNSSSSSSGGGSNSSSSSSSSIDRPTVSTVVGIKIIPKNDPPTISLQGVGEGILYDDDASYPVGIVQTNEDTALPLGLSFSIHDADMEGALDGSTGGTGGAGDDGLGANAGSAHSAHSAFAYTSGGTGLDVDPEDNAIWGSALGRSGGFAGLGRLGIDSSQFSVLRSLSSSQDLLYVSVEVGNGRLSVSGNIGGSVAFLANASSLVEFPVGNFSTGPAAPTAQPTSAPLLYPPPLASAAPSTPLPTANPTAAFRINPNTSFPTGQPTRQPTRQPTGQPSRGPTMQPTGQPTGQPTYQNGKSHRPTAAPTFGVPIQAPVTYSTGPPSADPDPNALLQQQLLDAANTEDFRNVTANIAFIGSVPKINDKLGYDVRRGGARGLYLRGLYREVQAVLKSLVYTPDTDWNGVDELTIYVNDLGNVGVDGERDQMRRILIDVLSVDDAPVVHMPSTDMLVGNEDMSSIIGKG